jgi:bleomycin hydrolase
MKKFTITLGLLLVTGMAISQSVGTKEQKPFTNKKGSKYEFTMIKDLDATPVQSQGQTGTCWSFSSLSFFESELIRMKKDPAVLSEMYIVRNAYLGKAEKFLRMNGHANFSEGGAFHDIPWVIRKYGILPYDEYTGLLDTDGYDHNELSAVLTGMTKALNEQVNEEDKTLSNKWKTAISGVLDAYLGQLPENVKDIKFVGDGK